MDKKLKETDKSEGTNKSGAVQFSEFTSTRTALSSLLLIR